MLSNRLLEWLDSQLEQLEGTVLTSFPILTILCWEDYSSYCLQPLKRAKCVKLLNRPPVLVPRFYLAVLDVIADEQLCAAAQHIGIKVMHTFAAIQKESPWVSDIRHLGAMCAIEFNDPQTGDPAGDLVAKICANNWNVFSF